MAIKHNPFEVGYSGPSAIEMPRTCQCCGIEFVWHGTEVTFNEDLICKFCTHHSVETLELEVSMYREHQPRLVNAVNKAREMARNLHKLNDSLALTDRDRRREIASALQARNNYRTVVTTLQETHYEDNGICSCGNQSCDVLEALSNYYSLKSQNRW